MQAWVGIGYKPTWEGEHSFSYDSTFESDCENLLDLIQFMSQALPSNHFLTRISIVQKALWYAIDRTKPNECEYCWICLERIANRQLNRCEHIFCEKCINDLKQTNQGQVPEPLNPEQVFFSLHSSLLVVIAMIVMIVLIAMIEMIMLIVLIV